MALVSVISAKGAPGATTTTLLLASLWPNESVVLDADAYGGDIALRLQAEDGRALDPGRGLMSLLPAARRGLPPENVVQHAQLALGGQQVITGLPGPEQSQAVAPMWQTLAGVFARVPGADVIVDAGRAYGGSANLPLLKLSDLVICVYRPTAWSAVHTARRLEGLHEALRDSLVKIGIVCVAASAESADQQAAAATIRDAVPSVLDLGTVAFDPRSVAMFEGGVIYRPERTMLARSGRALVKQAHPHVVRADAVLTPQPDQQQPDQQSADQPDAVDQTTGGPAQARSGAGAEGSRRGPRKSRLRKGSR